MKTHLLSLLSVVLVLSIKAYETTAHELNEQRKIGYANADVALTKSEVKKDTELSYIDSLVTLLSESNSVKEQQVGFSGATPREYLAYEALRDTADEKALNGLLTHFSPVVRVYAYRALVENDMMIDALYEETMLEDTTSVDWFSGLLLMPSSVQELVREESGR